LANIKSSQKKARQRIKRTARNVAGKSEMRTAIKKVRAALEKKDGKGAKTALAGAISLLDRAGRKGLIKKRTASRQVSRLTKAVASAG
jgi:small subunit ribosomal protein S20